MKRLNRLTSIILIVMLALIAVSCNPNSSIPGAPNVNTDKTSLAKAAEATERTEEQMASNFAVASLWAAEKKYGFDTPTTENAKVEFTEEYMPIANDRYYLWGTMTKTGRDTKWNLVMAYEHDAIEGRQVYSVTGTLSLATMTGTYTIAGKEYKIDLTPAKYY